MMTLYLIMNLMIFSLFLMLMINPLSMGILILMQTLLISLLICLSNQSSWFAYILFLTFLGGLLILFIYTASFSSNEMFNFNFYEIINLIIISSISLLSSLIISIKFPHLIDYFNNLEMFQMTYKNMFFNNENMMNNSQLYSSKFMMTLMMILYLLISMTIINKISNPFKGTFRIN